MFDIGLLELLLIAIVSLLVLGPEKLPGAVRSGTKTIYWFKRQASSAKEEINKAYLKIQKKIHPDISPETSRLSSIVNEARDVLLNEIK